jgi:hypothetical protein
MTALRIDEVARSFVASLAGAPPRRPLPSFVAQLAAALDHARRARQDRPLGRLCGDARACSLGTVCRDGTCRCAPGWESCGGDRCHFLPMSHAHCGRCGRACDPDQLCSNGRCV